MLFRSKGCAPAPTAMATSPSSPTGVNRYNTLLMDSHEPWILDSFLWSASVSVNSWPAYCSVYVWLSMRPDYGMVLT